MYFRKWAETSGRTGVEWDALNLVPELMTHWLTVPSFLSSISKHWSTGTHTPNYQYITAHRQGTLVYLIYAMKTCKNILKSNHKLQGEELSPVQVENQIQAKKHMSGYSLSQELFKVKYQAN